MTAISDKVVQMIRKEQVLIVGTANKMIDANDESLMTADMQW